MLTLITLRLPTGISWVVKPTAEKTSVGLVVSGVDGVTPIGVGGRT